MLLSGAAVALLSLTLGVPIIGYHEVDPSPSTGWGVRTADFIEQMELIDAAGYHVIPIARLDDYLTGASDTLPPHPIVLTVDDGWECAYTEIAPVLHRMHYPFSLYVYPAIIGHGSHALTWAQVRELQADGVDIEDHTMTHAHLMRSSHPEMDDAAYDAFLRNELAASKSAIEAETGQPVRFLAYPYGDHDSRVESEAQRDGYRLGLTSEPGLNARPSNLMRLHRLAVISDTTLDQFRAAIGLGDLHLENITPSSDVLTSNTVSATIADHARFHDVHVIALGNPDAHGSYDANTGRIALTFAAPPRAREEVVVVADDGTQRYAAIRTLYATAADRDNAIAQHEKLQTLPLHHQQATRGK